MSLVSSITKIWICAIALHELRYIDEWIQYHKLLGFDHIRLYDNSVDFELRNYSHLYHNFVHVTHYPGERPQMKAYADCAHAGAGYKKNSKMYKSKKWAAFIDIDEFIVLKHHTTIGNLLDDYVKDDVGCIGINWVLFGSSMRMNYSTEPVLKRFIYRSNQTHHTLKSICHMASVVRFSSPHWAILNDNTKLKYDMGGQVYDTHSSKVAYEYPAALYHYHTKSFEEYELKIQRGRATKTSTHERAHYNLSFYWHMRDINDREDLTAWNDFQNRMTIVKNISLPVVEIKKSLLKACNDNGHCNIAHAAMKLNHK
jgi:hypothetical protein